ncbi:hypothetical protein BJ508DRAFT_333208 [Ascobolus immersus RN42]|uniref:Uncharacterized protein n=1 Tax=Ascobolus immersus RN42 TaxID=1160509 RepID=A0A3N4HR90_ASCIM|nr:hypothetical protein BJ508DRAFT_333208 [Ascobolus immersus RN42]
MPLSSTLIITSVSIFCAFVLALLAAYLFYTIPPAVPSSPSPTTTNKLVLYCKRCFRRPRKRRRRARPPGAIPRPRAYERVPSGVEEVEMMFVPSPPQATLQPIGHPPPPTPIAMPAAALSARPAMRQAWTLPGLGRQVGYEPYGFYQPLEDPRTTRPPAPSPYLSTHPFQQQQHMPTVYEHVPISNPASHQVYVAPPAGMPFTPPHRPHSTSITVTTERPVTAHSRTSFEQVRPVSQHGYASSGWQSGMGGTQVVYEQGRPVSQPSFFGTPGGYGQYSADASAGSFEYQRPAYFDAPYHQPQPPQQSLFGISTTPPQQRPASAQPSYTTSSIHYTAPVPQHKQERLVQRQEEMGYGSGPRASLDGFVITPKSASWTREGRWGYEGYEGAALATGGAGALTGGVKPSIPAQTQTPAPAVSSQRSTQQTTAAAPSSSQQYRTSAPPTSPPRPPQAVPITTTSTQHPYPPRQAQSFLAPSRANSLHTATTAPSRANSRYSHHTVSTAATSTTNLSLHQYHASVASCPPSRMPSFNHHHRPVSPLLEEVPWGERESRALPTPVVDRPEAEVQRQRSARGGGYVPLRRSYDGGLARGGYAVVPGEEVDVMRFRVDDSDSEDDAATVDLSLIGGDVGWSGAPRGLGW